jgi:hypothetical protein
VAYKSFDELIDDASRNPKEARMRVAKAKQMNTPVVSDTNPGYRNKAITDRMGPASKKPKYSSSILKQKMTGKREEPDDHDYSEAEAIASKRKRVGY